MKRYRKDMLRNENAIAIYTKSEHSKTNRPSKEAVLASFEGRFLCIIWGHAILQPSSYYFFIYKMTDIINSDKEIIEYKA